MDLFCSRENKQYNSIIYLKFPHVEIFKFTYFKSVLLLWKKWGVYSIIWRLCRGLGCIVWYPTQDWHLRGASSKTFAELSK